MVYENLNLNLNQVLRLAPLFFFALFVQFFSSQFGCHESIDPASIYPASILRASA